MLELYVFVQRVFIFGTALLNIVIRQTATAALDTQTNMFLFILSLNFLSF